MTDINIQLCLRIMLVAVNYQTIIKKLHSYTKPVRKLQILDLHRLSAIPSWLQLFPPKSLFPLMLDRLKFPEVRLTLVTNS